MPLRSWNVNFCKETILKQVGAVSGKPNMAKENGAAIVTHPDHIRTETIGTTNDTVHVLLEIQVQELEDEVELGLLVNDVVEPGQSRKVEIYGQ